MQPCAPARSAVLFSALQLFLLFASPVAACSVCFGDPEQAGPVQVAILLLLALVVAIQVIVGRLFWRLMRGQRR